MPVAICLGEALIDFVSAVPVASIAAAPAFVPAAGGSPANAAVALARLGVSTGFVGKVGDDPFGKHLAETFARHGVDTSQLHFDATARTALAFVAVDEAGHPDFVFFRHPSADMLLRMEDLDPAYLSQAVVVHTGSIILTAEPARSTIVEALRLTRAAGRLVSLDPNVRMSLWGDEERLRAVLLPILELADVVKLSEEDMGPLVGTADRVAGSAAVMERGPRLVVVTRGRDGCFCRSPNATFDVPGFEVPVLDTTGAGDAFVAGLLTALLALGAPVRDVAELGEPELWPALRLANAVGAVTTTLRGGIPALPDRSTLRQFLSERGEAEALRLLG